MKTRQFTLSILFLTITNLLVMASISGSPFGDAAMVENKSFTADTIRMNFESLTDFSLTLSPWKNVDIDHNTTYGILNHSFPNDTVAKAFMVFNPSAVTPPMTDSAIKPHSGAKFGACFSSTPVPPSNNDWLISPKIHLGQNGSFTFWVKSYTSLYQLEEYKVLISVTDSATSSFTSISGSQALTAPTTWTRKMFNLSSYNNQDVYLAIQCVSVDHFILMVDDIEIITNATGTLKADFSSDKTQVSMGEAINFQDLSSGFPTTWQWSFPGGTPSSSVLQTPPPVTYSSPGNYDVSLAAGNGTATDTKTVSGYIHVGGYPASASLDFESLPDFTLDFSPWSTLDVKGGVTYIMVDGTGKEIVFPHSGQQMSYICFNPSATVPPEPYMKPHTGQKLGCCFSSIPPNNPNDKWLISPRLSLGTNAMLEMWVMTYNKTFNLERYNVAVSTTDNNPSSFTYLTTAYETAPDTWTKRTYDLKDYNNKTVYVAIQCVSDDQFIFMIDDLSITSLAGVDQNSRDLHIAAYPNPAHDFLTIDCELQSGILIRAGIVDVLGRTQRSQEFNSGYGPLEMNVKDLKPGIYSLVIDASGRKATQKIVIQ